MKKLSFPRYFYKTDFKAQCLSEPASAHAIFIVPNKIIKNKPFFLRCFAFILLMSYEQAS